MLADSPWLWKQFLWVRLHDVLENGREEEANKIQAVVRGENQRRKWRTIDREMSKTRTPASTMVETVDEGGTVTQYCTKDGVERVIHSKIGIRFSRAGSTSICNGPLFELLGYNADTEAGMEILEGTFKPPTGRDPATVIVLNEIARIWRLMGDEEVSIIITKEDFQHCWRRVKERRASSFLGRHVGHYAAVDHLDLLSEAHAWHLALITKIGAAPKRWSKGLSVMLEKILGVAVVTKLRVILLMEAGFNCHNRLILGDKMMKLAQENGLVPKEKVKTPEDVIF